jgi:hypothetical protein
LVPLQPGWVLQQSLSLLLSAESSPEQLGWAAAAAGTLQSPAKRLSRYRYEERYPNTL